MPRLGVDASRRGPDEDSRRGRDQAKNAVAATSRDRNPASGALIQDPIAITDTQVTMRVAAKTLPLRQYEV